MLPTTLVLFGATGDLVAKKIVPAMFHLYVKGKLPEACSIVAYARRDISTDDFRSMVAGILDQRISPRPSEEDINSFTTLFVYIQGQFDSTEDFSRLAKHLNQGNVLLYLAVPPELTPMIFKNCAASGLSATRESGWTRVIVEKPIGKSGETAEEIEGILCKTFDESQIYRIDHYLAKEMVQNILTFRFSNSLFEQSWNSRFIERIDIRLWETLGVETRGAFYDGLGALRDVGQNHLLQMLAFITMDHPEKFDAEAIRANRAKSLQRLNIPTEDDVRRMSVRAQYDGYRDITGVADGSDTETYFRLTATLDTPRWKDVPIMMEGGKRMGEARKEIVVTFRTPESCLCTDEGDEHHKNIVTFALEPSEGITIQFWSKKPGHDFTVEKRTLDFLLRDDAARAQYVEEYEKLFLDCIAGDQTLFVEHDEVRAMWRFIDPVVDAWKRGVVPLITYPPDTVPVIPPRL